MELSQSLNLYITFLEKEGPFLKLWGQTEKNSATLVEQFLAGISPQFNAGISKVPPESLQCGTLVCAKYTDDKYYRARILNIFVRDSIVEVIFIDFGNRDIISCENIRSLHDCPSSFISIPPLATGFIFAEAHCVGGGEWNDTIFESIAKEFRFHEVQCHLLFQATQYYLVKLYLDGTDLCSLLIQRGLMQPISLQAQQAVLLSMSIQRQTVQAPPSIQTSTAINTYKAVTLEPGCLYPVYVSYINDGPCQFSVQLKQSEDILAKLMKDINCVTLRLLEDIPIPGTLCLARCQEDGNVCRAVVTNEVDNQFKVYYVDFGNYEVISLDSLFQIPFKYVIPKVMAIRFALAGVEKPTVTIEMQVAFKKFVDNRMLHMKVLPTRTRVAVPKCELWDPETKTSALDVVNRAAQHAYPEPVSLNRGFSQPVKVSFVYSCNRFYVQLTSKETELSNLMLELQEICQTSDSIEASEIKTGLPCCALFLGDSLWYRSQVVEVLGETVKVRYIDFGNEEEVDIGLLKTIDGEQLTVLRPQAIECCLNGYQNMGDDPERDGFLEEIILEDTFTMKVVEMFGKKALVELFDSSNYNVASLLLDKIAAAKSQVSPMLVQAGNKIEHRKSYSQQGQTPHREGYSQNREGQRDNYRGDRDSRTGRDDSNWNSKPDDRNEKSWRQDSRGNRNFDKNSNDNDERSSWRDNNKGFSPNNYRQNKQTSQDGDSWNTNNNAANTNSDWNTTETNQPVTSNWETVSDSNTLTNNEWNTPSNDGGFRQNRKQDDYGRNKRGFDNDRGSKFDNDRGSRFDNDNYAGKKREGGGYGRKPDYRKDDGQLSPSGSETSYHKGPRTSSRNDRGGRGGRFERNYDKPRGASHNSYSAGEDSWNVSALAPSIDVAPVSASFTQSEVVGTETKVIISWFHNPCHFFCQIADSQDKFKIMMEEIQEFYKNRKPELSVVGAPVIGLFPEDNVLYRAQVLEVIGTSYKVYYVDFGNVSTVDKIWPIDKKFMVLPAQAIACSLNDIAPPGDNWCDPDSFSKYFEKENFTCSFINKDEEKTYVNIFYESEDIAQLLIQDGLAVSTYSIIPDIEIPLLLGQQFRAVLKSVNNLSDIIIALECGLAVSCTMHNLETATEIFEDQLRGLLEQTVIVYVDNVIDDRLEVTLYDTEGNKHVVLNPDEGALDTVELTCPMLVLRSTVTGYVPYADETKVFIQPVEYSELVEYLLCQLFDTYNDQPQEAPIIPEEGLLFAVHSEDGNWYRGRVVSFDDEKATVCFVDYGNLEEVAFSELRILETNLLEISILCLQVMVSSDATTFIDKEVTASITYGEEGWEGTVNLIESSATESANIDEFGNTGLTSTGLEEPDDVRDITESCTFNADEVTVEDEHKIVDIGNPDVQDETTVPIINDVIVEGEQELPVVDSPDSQDEIYVADIQNDTTISNIDVEAEVEDVDPVVEDGELRPYSDESEIIIGTPVYISHVDSPSEFYLQFHEPMFEIGDLRKMIQTCVPEWSVLENPSAGIICAAPYSGDQKWYRAEILDADDDITTVRFIDFGNTDVIDNKTTKIKMLPPNLLSLAAYATRCSLKVEPVDEEWSTNAISVFEKFAMTGFVTAEFLDQNEKTNYVELYSDSVNIREALIQQKLAVSSTQTEEIKSTGFVSHLNSPSEFWIQLENCVDELEWIAEQLSSAESFDELEDLAPGTLCAALFPEDQMWYRARILSNTVAGIELLFIDYGNSSTSSSLRQLPEDLVVTAPLAQKCSLQKPEGILVWSPEAAAKFSEISADGQTIFTVKKISTGETSVVQLFINEEDVSTMLLPDTEEGYVKAVDGLEQLQIEKVDGEPVEGSFRLEALSGQELNEEAEQNFEQINNQGSTLFQIEFVDTNTVRLYLNGHDIRQQLGEIKNASFESSNIEDGDFHSNEEVKVSVEQTENEDCSFYENESGVIQDNSLLPCQATVSSEQGEEIAIVDQIETSQTENNIHEDESVKTMEHDHLEDPVSISLEADAKPTVETSTDNTESHNTELVHDNSQSEYGPPGASTESVIQSSITIPLVKVLTVRFSSQDPRNFDTIESSTQTDAGEYAPPKLSVPEESKMDESPKSSLAEDITSSPVKSQVECSDVEFQNDGTVQDSSQTSSNVVYEPQTSTAIIEESVVEEIPDVSSVEDNNVARVQHCSQILSNVEYEPQTSTATLEKTAVEESPDISFVEDNTVATVQDSSKILGDVEYEPQTSTATLEKTAVEESPDISLVKDNTVATVQDSSQINVEYDPHTSTANLENTVVEYSPDVSSVEDNAVATVQDSSKILSNVKYEPQTSTAILEETIVEQSPGISSVEYSIVTPTKSLAASTNHELQYDDTLHGSSQTGGCKSQTPTAGPKESVVEESPKKLSPVDNTTDSPVKSPVVSSDQEPQSDSTLQDNSWTVSTAPSAGLEESDVEKSPKVLSSIEDITASNVESVVASSNQDPQIDDRVQENSQNFSSGEYELPTYTADSEKSDISPSDEGVADPNIISPEVSSPGKELQSSRTLDADESQNATSPEIALEETEVKVSGSVEAQQLNEEDDANHIVLLENIAVPDNINSSDSGNESYPTTPQKNLECAATTKSPDESQSLDAQKCPETYSFDDDVTIESSSQNLQDNDEGQEGIEGEGVLISPKKCLEKVELSDEICGKIHPADLCSERIEVSLEESTDNTSSEAVQIDVSINDSVKSEHAEESCTGMNIIMRPDTTLSSLNKDEGNDTVSDSVKTSREVTDGDNYSESQLFPQTELPELSVGEQASRESSEEPPSNKNDADEKDITITLPEDQSSIIKSSDVGTDDIGQTPGCPSPEKKKKSVHKPAVGKDTKKTPTPKKTSPEKVVPASPVKSNIRVSLSVAKLLASKKDEITSPTKKASKAASSSELNAVSKTPPKKNSARVDAKSTHKKPHSIKTFSSEPIKKSPSEKNYSPKRTSPAKTISGSSKNSSPSKTDSPGTSKDLDNAKVLKKSVGEISGRLGNNETKTSMIDTETVNSKIDRKVFSEDAQEEENSQATNMLESDDEDRKAERSELENNSLLSNFENRESVEDIEQEKK